MAWVVVQLALLTILAMVPGTALSWTFPSISMAGAGLAIVAWSSLCLGRSLTPFPDPAELGRFTATGPYRLLRHPMYAGVMLLALGFAVATYSLPRFSVVILLVAYFDAKSRYEERVLSRHYSEYADYRRRTRRFVPFVY